MHKIFFVALLLVSVCTGIVRADDRQDGVRVLNRCLQAVRAGNESGVLAEFAATEKNDAATLNTIKTLQPLPIYQQIVGVSEKETGSSNAEFEGQSILYLFGELLKTDGTNQHFSADLVKEGSTWKIVRLGISKLPTLGTARLSYEKVPQVNNAVNSMIAGERVLNEFMVAGGQNDVQKALSFWVKSEREKPGKARELRALFMTKSEYFKDFIEVVEGKTDFVFKTQGTAVNGVSANGKMSYKSRDLRRFKAELQRENGTLKIKTLTF